MIQDTRFPPPHKPDPRAILKQNQEEIKKDVARLTEIVAELQKPSTTATPRKCSRSTSSTRPKRSKSLPSRSGR